MNCPYRIVFYNNNTMPLSFLPHLGGTLSFLPPPSRGRIEVGALSYFSPSPLPSPIEGEGERRTSVKGEGNRSELFTYDNITER